MDGTYGIYIVCACVCYLCGECGVYVVCQCFVGAVCVLLCCLQASYMCCDCSISARYAPHRTYVRAWSFYGNVCFVCGARVVLWRGIRVEFGQCKCGVCGVCGVRIS